MTHRMEVHIFDEKDKADLLHASFLDQGIPSNMSKAVDEMLVTVRVDGRKSKVERLAGKTVFVVVRDEDI